VKTVGAPSVFTQIWFIGDFPIANVRAAFAVMAHQGNEEFFPGRIIVRLDDVVIDFREESARLKTDLNLRHNRDMLCWAFKTNFTNSNRRATRKSVFDMAPQNRGNELKSVTHVLSQSVTHVMALCRETVPAAYQDHGYSVEAHSESWHLR